VTMRTFLLMAVAILLASCSDQRAPEKAAPEAPKPLPARVAPAKILHFYGSPISVGAGGNVTICYGVESARSVRIEPPVAELRPLYNKCVQAAPTRTTTYRLIAEGADGKTVTESFTVEVKGGGRGDRAPSLISIFTAQPEQVAKGQPVTLCYIAPDAAELAIEPMVRSIEPGRRCFGLVPEKTTTYTLTATGENGTKERRRVTVTVK